MIVELDHRLFLEQDYGLINPLQVGKEHYADLEVHRLMPKGFARHERMLPLLVPLGSLEREQRIELLERTEEWARNHHMPFFSALFTSQHEAGYVRAMLVDRMVSRRPDQVSVWLRFHDPRVFRHLQWLLDPKQVPALMGPAVTWLGFDPLCRHWHCWSRPDSPGNQRLRLSQEQWQSVEQFEALNRCLRDLAELELPTDDDAARRVLESLLEARRNGLVQDAAAIRFALRRQTGEAESQADAEDRQGRPATLNI